MISKIINRNMCNTNEYNAKTQILLPKTTAKTSDDFVGATALSNYSKSFISNIKFGKNVCDDDKFATNSLCKMLKEQNIPPEYNCLINNNLPKIKQAASGNYLNLNNIGKYLKYCNFIPDIPFLLSLSDDNVNIDKFIQNYVRTSKMQALSLQDVTAIKNRYAAMYFGEYNNKSFDFDSPYDEYVYFNKLFASNGMTIGHNLSELQNFVPYEYCHCDDLLEAFNYDLINENKKPDIETTKKINIILEKIVNSTSNNSISDLTKELKKTLSNLQIKIKAPFISKNSENESENLHSILQNNEFQKLNENDKKNIILANTLKNFYLGSISECDEKNSEIFYALEYIDKLDLSVSDKSKLQLLVKHRNCFETLQKNPSDTNITKFALELRYLNSFDLLKILSEKSLKKTDKNILKKFEQDIKKYQSKQLFIAQSRLPEYPKGKLHIIEEKPKNVLVHGISNPFGIDNFEQGMFNSFRFLNNFKESDYVISATLLNDKTENLFGNIGFIIDVAPKDLLLGHTDMNELRSGMKKNINTIAHFLSLDCCADRGDENYSPLYGGTAGDFLSQEIKKNLNIKNDADYTKMFDEIKDCKYVDDMPDIYKKGFLKFQNSLGNLNEIMVKSPKIKGLVVSKNAYPQKNMIPGYITAYAKAEGLPVYYF